MSRTEFVRWATGQNVYAKPSPLDDDPSWADDVVVFAEVDSTGQYTGTIGDGHHEAFVRGGATPASTDRAIKDFPALLNVPSAEEISNRLERTDGPIDKVPKFDDTIQRDKTSASSSQMVETLTKVTE